MTLAGRIRGKDVKTDNRSLPTKLAMRTRVLQAAGVTEARVLDVCAGEGRIWDAMRRRIAVAQYVPCDKTSRRPGAFELEAIQAIRVFDLAEFNVIDIDPYGDPWWIYFMLLPLLRTKTCIFLTWGTLMPSGALKSLSLREAAGIPRAWNVPADAKMLDYVVQFALAKTLDYSIIDFACEAKSGFGRYYGLVVTPKGT